MCVCVCVLTDESNVCHEAAMVVVMGTAGDRVRCHLAVHVEVCQSGPKHTHTHTHTHTQRAQHGVWYIPVEYVYICWINAAIMSRPRTPSFSGGEWRSGLAWTLGFCVMIGGSLERLHLLLIDSNFVL